MADFPKQLLASPSGFPDLTPGESIAVIRVLDIIRKHFEQAGYSPLVTSLVERAAVLTAKSEGEINSQIYGLRLLNPSEGANDEKDLALRFDHTVPLARYVAAHGRELAFPYRRYAIGSVLRGERAKDGRYREFIQADIDAIGDESLSSLHDAEMIAVIVGIFTELSVGAFTIRINNRKVLAGLLENAGIETAHLTQAMRAIDRLEKVGEDATSSALATLGIPEASARGLINILTTKRSIDETLAFLKEELTAEGMGGAAELEEVVRGARALGIAETNFFIDLSIARGLDYYTGTVYETRLDDHLDLGSVASGGRYDDLASAFTEHRYPGVGISIGVTRLLLRLIQVGLIEASKSTNTRLLITTAEPSALETYLKRAATLRAQGIACEVYLEPKPLDKQLAFANKKGFAFALIAKQEHLDKEIFVLRNLSNGDQREIAAGGLVSGIQNILG